MLLFLTPYTQNHGKEIRLTEKLPNESVIYTCAAFPPAGIRQLPNLAKYHFKLTCMITGEKNRAHNCLTIYNLKLDDVFSDIFENRHVP